VHCSNNHRAHHSGRPWIDFHQNGAVLGHSYSSTVDCIAPFCWLQHVHILVDVIYHLLEKVSNTARFDPQRTSPHTNSSRNTVHAYLKIISEPVRMSSRLCKNVAQARARRPLQIQRHRQVDANAGRLGRVLGRQLAYEDVRSPISIRKPQFQRLKLLVDFGHPLPTDSGKLLQNLRVSHVFLETCIINKCEGLRNQPVPEKCCR